jgi:hypothetical protein
MLKHFGYLRYAIRVALEEWIFWNEGLAIVQVTNFVFSGSWYSGIGHDGLG